MAPNDFVSSDGSPLSIYLALPPGENPLLIHEAIAPASRVLELASGPGRLTRVLLALGHEVTAVDASEEMLAHVTGATTVVGDVFDLELEEHFDVVVAASNLINRPGESNRRDLLRSCRRHLEIGGTLLIERYSPGWILTATASATQMGLVRVSYEPGLRVGQRREAAVSYRLAGHWWRQRFVAEDVTDEMMNADAEAEGFVVEAMLDSKSTWVRLTAAK